MLDNQFRILSWNTAKRVKYTAEQYLYLKKLEPDVVALQEVLPKSVNIWREVLSADYSNIISSFDLAPDHSILKSKRMFGQLIASKFPVTPIPPDRMNVPWQERVLSMYLYTGKKKIRFITTHIPPGSSNGWIKIQMIKGLVESLIFNESSHQILCGDFNTPRSESSDFGVVTFGQRITKSGKPSVRRSFRGGLGQDWDRWERALFEELPLHGIRDAFRTMHPQSYDAYSWSFTRKGKIFRNRFDHFFVSAGLEIKSCDFSNDQGNLSDHSPVLVVVGGKGMQDDRHQIKEP